MENFNNLITLGQKQDRGTLTAAEWNHFVNTVINSANSCPRVNQTLTVESKIDDSWNPHNYVSTDTGISIPAGGEYKVRGFLDGDITVSGQTGAKTIIHLDGILIKSSTGTCIKYDFDSKSVVIILEANSENYLYQLSEDSSAESLGCIKSKNNLTLKGEGYLLLVNKIGHGIKANELNITGRPNIVFDTVHDAIHGDNIVNIEEGNFYVKNAHDVVGSSEREINPAATPPVDDTGKLRGIIRVFGGNFYVEKIKSGQFVFDAKYSYMGVVETTVEDTTTVTYYTQTEIEASNGSIVPTYKLTSKIFSPFVSVQGPALTPTNICSDDMAAYSIDTTTGTVSYKAGDAAEGTEYTTLTPDANGVYILPTDQYTDGNQETQDHNEKASVLITGYIQGLIVINPVKAELCLNGATLVPLSETQWAAVTGNNNAYNDAYNEVPHSTVIYYVPEDGNVTIQTNGNSEGNYIAGGVVSNNNIKITPKSSSALYTTNSGSSPFIAGTITIYNGAGSFYSYGSAKGLDGNEIIIGSEIDGWEANKQLKGNVYLLHNSEYDLYARTSSKNKKGIINITYDIKGEIITETVGAAKTFLIAVGGTEVTTTGIIMDGVTPKPNSKGKYKGDYTFTGNLQSLKYTKLAPTTTLYGGEKYGKTINGELAKYFN